MSRLKLQEGHRTGLPLQRVHCLLVSLPFTQGRVTYIDILLFFSILIIHSYFFFWFECSEQGPWSAMIAYEACVRICLHSWSMDSVSEASYFLKNECTIMRNAFNLQKFFLQSEEELLGKRPSELVTETSAPKSKKTIGKIRLEGIQLHLFFLPLHFCSTCVYESMFFNSS